MTTLKFSWLVDSLRTAANVLLGEDHFFQAARRGVDSSTANAGIASSRVDRDF
jgi:hypothetical protein